MELSTDFSENLGKLDEELIKAIDFLNKIDSPTRIFSDIVAYNYFVFIGKAIFYSYKLDIDFDIFLRKNFEVFIASLLDCLFKINSQLDFSPKIEAHNAQLATSVNEKRIIGLSFTLYVTNILIRVSDQFCVKFLLKNGLRAHMLFLEDSEFVKKNQLTKISLLFGDFFLLDQIVLNVASMSKKTCDEHKRIWFDLNAIGTLFRIAKCQEYTWFAAYMSIADLANDKQMDELTDIIYPILDKVVAQVVQCKVDFDANAFRRERLDIIFNGKSLECEVHAIKDPMCAHSYALKELVVCLYKFSIHEKLKHHMFYTYDVKNCLKVFIKKGKFAVKSTIFKFKKNHIKTCTKINNFSPKINKNFTK